MLMIRLFFHLFLLRTNDSQSKNYCFRAHRNKLGSDDSKNLDLAWKLYEAIEVCDPQQSHSCGYTCSICQGEGNILCKFCKGTGFLMLGDELIGTCNDCPVCKGNGEMPCKLCAGSGMIAHWVKDN